MALMSGSSPTFTTEIPDGAVGEKTLIAIGLDAGGAPVAASNEVTLDVTVPAALTGLDVYPPAAYLQVGATESFEIRGQYDDGIERNLSQIAGLTFAFTEGHASKSGTNGVTLNELLDDTLTISYQGVSATEVKIRALPPEQPRVTAKPIRRRLSRT